MSAIFAEKAWTDAYQKMVDDSVTTVRRLSRLPLLWGKSQAVKKGATPSQVVYEDGRVRLLRYTNGQPTFKPPLLFVFALVNRPYILDLKPGKSVIEHFVRGGFDTYLIDWGIPSDADKHLTLDDHINGYMRNAVNYLREQTGVDRVNLLGYCMGGTMSAMFAALHPQLVRNLILMAAGIDFGNRDGLLQLWTSEEYFDVDQFVDTLGNVPPQFLQSAFLMLKPIQNLIEKPISLWERLDDDKFVEEFFTMEGWLQDNIPVPGEVFREFVKYLYQQNRLVAGTMPVGQHTVNLKNITCPILNIMARRDDLVPCSQSQPFNDLVGSTDRKTLQLDAGHIGLAVGSRAQKELWPSAVHWLTERSDQLPQPEKPQSND